MLSFAVKRMKTCSSLRKKRSYIAQLSIANPRELRFFTRSMKLQVRSHSSQSQQYEKNSTSSVSKKMMLHMREIKFSQLRTSELCSSTWWITRFFGGVKEKSEHACFSQIVIPMCLSPSLANTYYRSHLIPCAFFPARL